MIDPAIGQKVLGRYRILRSLAVGGMGVIYLGRSEGAAGFAKPVVIKRVVADFAASDTQALDYFVREASILAELRHPGIVSVVDFGEEDGTYTMVLEYVHGFHLGQWLRYLSRSRRDFPADLAIHVACSVLDALEHAHDITRPDGTKVHVVHRDVTPSNVLIDVEGHVKLADFGIARITQAGEEQTQSGVVRGKMPYLAPELLHGKAASPSTDVYSVGVMLHELLLGRNDFRSESPAETVRLVLQALPSPVELVREDVPRGIDAVFARALAKTREERFGSARELHDALRALLPESSDVLARRLAARVAQDFAAIPAALGVEPLEEREAAWRNAIVGTEGAKGRSLRPGESSLLEASTRRIDLPTRAYDRTRGGRPESGGDGTSDTVEMASVPPGPRVSTPAPARSRLPLFAGLAVLVGVGVGVGVYFVTARAPRPTTPRFIVVESNEDEPLADPEPEIAEAPPPEPSSAPPASEALAAPEPSAPAVGARAPTAPEGEGSIEARVNQAFAARRPAIRACFERHTVSLAGSPAVEIRFRLAPDGHVESTSLSPAGLQGTELGSCLLGVARGTRFPAAGRPLAFSIPVTASRVAR